MLQAKFQTPHQGEPPAPQLVTMLIIGLVISLPLFDCLDAEETFHSPHRLASRVMSAIEIIVISPKKLSN